MKLHFIRSPKKRSAVLEELFAVLTHRGFEVTEGIPDTAVQNLDLIPQHDLYILKTRTRFAVSVAGVLHHRGARLLNPYPSCLTLLDKIVVTAAMRHAGIPTPRSWAAADSALLSTAITEGAPRVIKPFDGIHSQGIRVVGGPDELSKGPVTVGPVIIQEFVQGCTKRFKIHCVGDRVFATWKPFSLGGTHVPGHPCTVTDDVQKIALRCGALFGVGLYGLDVLVGRDGPVVVDVNAFPGYAGLPAIAPVIADYVDAYAHEKVSLAALAPRSAGVPINGIATQVS
jgi:ribosomal protein S6--L-glutamate ligase